MSITLLFVIVGFDFKMEGSGSVHDMISASALAASSWMHELKPKQMPIPIIMVLNFILLNY